MALESTASSTPPTQLHFARARGEDLSEIEAMLSSAGLPTADVREHLAEFLVARFHSSLVGVAAVQSMGEHAFLRSVCVAESHRGRGIASALCERLLDQARMAGA